MEKFEIITKIGCEPKDIYDTWLDEDKHAELIGGQAEIKPEINSTFTMWDDYIEGKIIELEKDKKIVQKWRTIEFPDGSPDSTIEIILEKIKNGTKLTIKHYDIPDGQGDSYKQGWEDYYFKPLKFMFG